MPLPATTPAYNAAVTAGNNLANLLATVSSSVGPTYTAPNGVTVDKMKFLMDLQKAISDNQDLQAQLLPYELRSEVL